MAYRYLEAESGAEVWAERIGSDLTQFVEDNSKDFGERRVLRYDEQGGFVKQAKPSDTLFEGDWLIRYVSSGGLKLVGNETFRDGFTRSDWGKGGRISIVSVGPEPRFKIQEDGPWLSMADVVPTTETLRQVVEQCRQFARQNNVRITDAIAKAVTELAERTSKDLAAAHHEITERYSATHRELLKDVDQKLRDAKTQDVKGVDFEDGVSEKVQDALDFALVDKIRSLKPSQRDRLYRIVDRLSEE